MFAVLGTDIFWFTASFSWKPRVSTGFYSNDITHVKDLKNFVEDRHPGGDLLFVAPRVEISRDPISFAPLD